MENWIKDLQQFPFDFDKEKLLSEGCVPHGPVMFGPDNPMYGLKGKNHPSSNFCRDDTYRKNLSEAVMTKQWKENDKRRQTHSKKMSETWENNYEYMAAQSRKNGNHGMRGKEIHNTLDIEYKGVIYYGWNELKESTGVTKHLYKKYYEKGIDPEKRIGANGPVAKEKGVQ